MNLVGHILRLIDPFYDLPKVTVPSAACDDEQTAAWSDESYARDLAEEHKTRGLLGLAAVGGLIAAMFLGCGTAKADPAADYAIRNAAKVCATLDAYPTFDGVTGTLAAVMRDSGLSMEDSAAVLVHSVAALCPNHWALLQAYGDSAPSKRVAA